MAAASDYLEDALLDHILGVASYTAPANLYLALATESFADDGSGAGELAGGSYARQVVTFNASSGGIATNDADVTFTNLNGVSVTPISHYGIFDASSGGNLIIHGAMTSAKTVADGEDAVIRAGQLSVQMQ